MVALGAEGFPLLMTVQECISFMASFVEQGVGEGSGGVAVCPCSLAGSRSDPAAF